MCGRFLLDADFDSILYYYGYLINGNTEINFPRGDIFPSNNYPIIAKHNKIISLKWGLNAKYLKKNIINARSESLFSKPLYKKIFNNRCLIIASAFYEWDDKTKVKYKISGENPFIAMGGIYSRDAFAIITKEANGFMKGIHPRMPLILKKGEEHIFLTDDSMAKEIINKPVSEKICLKPDSSQQISLF